MKFLAMILVALVISSAIAQVAETDDAYLCITDMTSGFAYTNGRWKEVSFDGGDKYLVRKRKESDMHESGPWVYLDFGESVAKSRCNNPPDKYGLLLCTTGIMEFFRMNVKSLRFELYSAGSYVAFPGSEMIVSAVGHQGSYIDIGKCSPL